LLGFGPYAHSHSTSVIITTVFFLVFIYRYCRIETIETLDDCDLLTTMRTLLFIKYKNLSVYKTV